MTSHAASSPDLRLTQLTEWLAAIDTDATLDIAPLDLATLTLASSDAGFRRYFRLSTRPVGDRAALAGDDTQPPTTANAYAAGTADTADDRADTIDTALASRLTLIAMDAPPPEKSREFVQIQQLLRDAGLHVPTILAADVERGFMLLNDLGSTAYIDVLSPTDEAAARPMMRDALRQLIQWQVATQPNVLPAYDEALLRRELDLFPEWYISRHLGRTLETSERDGLESVFRLLIDNALGQPQLFVHRDFMPRNLMVCPPSPAVLDFQDAVLGPATYDVVSLFRDAFISWEEGFELDGIAWYWSQAKAAGLPVRSDFAEYYRELEWTGLQRHLKILGLFARLNYRDGKPRYLADVPRFLAYASKVAHRYRELRPLARLLTKLENRPETVGYTF